MNALSDQDAAYIAGIIDGEGCIGIYGSHLGVHLSLTVIVVSTHRPLVEWLHGVTGIGHLRTDPPPKPRHRQSWRWTIRSKAAAGLLRSIRPRLIVKALQADFAVEFADTMTSVGTVHSLSEAVYEHRAALCASVRRLNCRGQDLVGPGDIRIEVE